MSCLFRIILYYYLLSEELNHLDKFHVIMYAWYTWLSASFWLLSCTDFDIIIEVEEFVKDS